MAKPSRPKTRPADRSTPIELGDQHPAYERINLADRAAQQLTLLLKQLVKEVAALDRDENGIVAMALASRCRRLASAASRLLSEPTDEINLEECAEEVQHG